MARGIISGLDYSSHKGIITGLNYGNLSGATHTRGALKKYEKDYILNYKQHGKCARCHRPLSMSMADFDHKQSLGAGGSNQIRNWQALHPNCHRMKTKSDMKKITMRKKRMRSRRGALYSGMLGGTWR
jgi:5-methylcytosine-specific restriction endonuclease McrA